MEKVTFSIPSMWADHHVLSVRDALGQVSGVEEITASAMYKDVLVMYDPSTTTPDALAGALASAGFEIAKAPPIPSYPERTNDTSDWFQFQERITETDMRDLMASGDHRNY